MKLSYGTTKKLEEIRNICLNKLVNHDNEICILIPEAVEDYSNEVIVIDEILKLYGQE